MIRFEWNRGKQVLAAIWVLMPLFATILWLALLLGVLLLPNLLVPFVSPDTAARDLLHICRLWYATLLLAVLAGFSIILLAGYFAGRRLRAGGIGVITLVCLIFPCLILFGLVPREELFSKFRQAGADLTEIETGFLVQAEVWISPKSHPAPPPGPYSEYLTEVSTRYGIIGEDTGGQWVHVYVPDTMDFSLDQDRLYDETQVIAWNREHARRYRVRYTSNFHLVVEITPIGDEEP